MQVSPLIIQLNFPVNILTQLPPWASFCYAPSWPLLLCHEIMHCLKWFLTCIKWHQCKTAVFHPFTRSSVFIEHWTLSWELLQLLDVCLFPVLPHGFPRHQCTSITFVHYSRHSFIKKAKWGQITSNIGTEQPGTFLYFYLYLLILIASQSSPFLLLSPADTKNLHQRRHHRKWK